MDKDKPFEIKKLNEDDILEIIIEHFQENQFKNMPCAKGILLGTPGKDLRFVGIFSKLKQSKLVSEYDLDKLDKEIDFNGDHSFLEENPDFYLKT